MAKERAIPARWLARAWRSGTSGTVPCCCWRSNSGDSCIVERATQTLAASAAPTKKGMRQPQLCRLGFAHRATVSAETPTASSPPISLAAEADEAMRPRRPRRRAFEQIGNDAGIFAADREAHHAAQEEQQPAGGGTDRGAGRKQCGGEHCRGHQRDRQQHHVPPPAPVADMAEDDRAERAHQIGDREAAERDQQRLPPPPKKTRASTVAK